MNKAMINPKRPIDMARKWQRIALIGRRRISASGPHCSIKSNASSKSVAEKGYFIVYSADGMHFAFPLSCLSSPIFKELFKMSEEEFGLPNNGPITIPCNAGFMENIVSLVRQRHASKNGEKSLLVSIAANQCSASLLEHEGITNQQLLVQVF